MNEKVLGKSVFTATGGCKVTMYRNGDMPRPNPEPYLGAPTPEPLPLNP